MCPIHRERNLVFAVIRYSNTGCNLSFVNRILIEDTTANIRISLELGGTSREYWLPSCHARMDLSRIGWLAALYESKSPSFNCHRVLSRLADDLLSRSPYYARGVFTGRKSFHLFQAKIYEHPPHWLQLNELAVSRKSDAERT